MPPRPCSAPHRLRVIPAVIPVILGGLIGWQALDEMTMDVRIQCASMVGTHNRSDFQNRLSRCSESGCGDELIGLFPNGDSLGCGDVIEGDWLKLKADGMSPEDAATFFSAVDEMDWKEGSSGYTEDHVAWLIDHASNDIDRKITNALLDTRLHTIQIGPLYPIANVSRIPVEEVYRDPELKVLLEKVRQAMPDDNNNDFKDAIWSLYIFMEEPTFHVDVEEIKNLLQIAVDKRIPVAPLLAFTSEFPFSYLSLPQFTAYLERRGYAFVQASFADGLKSNRDHQKFLERDEKFVDPDFLKPRLLDIWYMEKAAEFADIGVPLWNFTSLTQQLWWNRQSKDNSVAELALNIVKKLIVDGHIVLYADSKDSSSDINNYRNRENRIFDLIYGLVKEGKSYNEMIDLFKDPWTKNIMISLSHDFNIDIWRAMPAFLAIKKKTGYQLSYDLLKPLCRVYEDANSEQKTQLLNRLLDRDFLDFLSSLGVVYNLDGVYDDMYSHIISNLVALSSDEMRQLRYIALNNLEEYKHSHSLNFSLAGYNDYSLAGYDSFDLEEYKNFNLKYADHKREGGDLFAMIDSIKEKNAKKNAK